MITNSFMVLDKMSQKKELSIWKQGILTWNEFIKAEKIKGIKDNQKQLYDIQLELAKKHLLEDNHEYFRKILPSAEQWRLYNHFKSDAVYLDIEISSSYGDITVIGLYDGYDTKTMVKGVNLERNLLINELNKYKLLITYNGKSFDVPIIERYFGTKIRIPHIDLKTVCNRIGLKGGLKEVERALGIKRPEELELMRGHHAVEAWRMFQATGDRRFLDLLIRYNEEDIINLKPVAERSIKTLWNSIYYSK